MLNKVYKPVCSGRICHNMEAHQALVICALLSTGRSDENIHMLQLIEDTKSVKSTVELFSVLQKSRTVNMLLSSLLYACSSP